ncbi:MAG: ankyrin repeat domain-containing protein [Akkermansia sp.]|nr:ankyrin repeat domain-containing protein [Akkermansia sp.]
MQAPAEVPPTVQELPTKPPKPPTLPIGHKLLDNYRIESVLGYGSFGITYRATELITGCAMTLKENYPADFVERDPVTHEVRPRPGYDMSYEWAMNSFVKEALTLRQLPPHDNLVWVAGVFGAFNTAYILMSYVDGKNLHELYPNGSQIEEDKLLHLLRSILSALVPLHARGIVHRDIKPSNIMLTSEGAPVLIDFGAARPTKGTHVATQIGTPGYAPPEQMSQNADNADNGNAKNSQQPKPCWDLYALGATCYRLITGKEPAYVPEKLADTPEWSNKYSVDLLRSIDKARDLTPDNRWQNPQEWLNELPGTHEPNTPQPSSTPPLRKRHEAISCLKQWGIESYLYEEKLAEAIRDNEPELFSLLLAAGADINSIIAEKGTTPLHLAVTTGASNLLALLIRQPDIDLNKTNDRGESALCLAAATGHTECLKLLLTAPGIYLNQKNNRGETALCLAAANGHTECLKLLLAAPGISINKADKKGYSPLIRAARAEHYSCMQALLTAPGISTVGFTPLGLAVVCNNPAQVRRLLDTPGTKLKKSGISRSPLALAKATGHTECARLLTRAHRLHSAKIISVMSAIVLFTWLIFGYTYGTFMAIEYNCPILLRSYRSLPKINELYPKEEQLLRAILYDTPECAQVLIDEGADINTTKWWGGDTPLSKAAWFGRHECVKLLLNTPGIDINKKNNNGNTAYDCANSDSYYRSWRYNSYYKDDIIKLLQERGAKPSDEIQH